MNGRLDPDVARRSFAAGAVWGWLTTDSRDQLGEVLDVRERFRDADRATRGEAIRAVVLAARNGPWLAPLAIMLAGVELTTDDVDWAMLDAAFDGDATPPG